MDSTRHSLIVPVYGNEASIPALLDVVEDLSARLEGGLEAVFVVDGSPDESAARLRDGLDDREVSGLLIELSRNFGSFAAIRHGLAAARGPWFAVMSADLQEPPELILEFFRALADDECDVVLARRRDRDDRLSRRLPATLFWRLYRAIVQPEMPAGGVDVFGLNARVRAALMELEPTNTSLVGQLIWLGFRREVVPYHRRVGTSDSSGWSLGKRFRYMADSLLAFTDLPLRLLVLLGALGCTVTVIVSLVVSTAYLRGSIDTPGYTPIILALMFSTFLMLLGLGIVGSYVWRDYENSKGRPAAVEMSRRRFGPRGAG